MKKCGYTKFLMVLPILFFFILFSVKDVKSTEVSSVIDVTYFIDKGRNVKVQYSIKETNLTEDKKLKSETIKIPGKLSSIKVFLINDGRREEIPFLDKQDDDYHIVDVYFQNLKFGSGQTISWLLEGALLDSVEIVGNLRYFFVNGIIRTPEIKSYNVQVVYPKEVGGINYVSTTHYEVINEGETQIVKLTDRSFDRGYVLIVLGNEQYYYFSLKYKVAKGVEGSVIIPPDTVNQVVIFTSLKPAPDSYFRDQDGNYILNYKISDKNVDEIFIEGYATVKPYKNYKETVSSENVNEYLKEDKFWEYSSTSVLEKIKELTSNLSSNYEKSSNIYNFVVSRLKYAEEKNIQARERLGAEGVWKDPDNAVCQEFSDLFIAMSRGAGIPAREVDGYAVDIQKNIESPMVLHSWAEFWDGNYGWVAVDPTWENTSKGNYFNNIGSDHFIWMFRGTSSTSPIIPTTFLANDDPADNIKISPIPKIPILPLYEVSSNVLGNNCYFGLGCKLKLKIENKGNTVANVKSVSIKIGERNLSKNVDKIVLPFTSLDIDVDMNIVDLVYVANKNVEIEVHTFDPWGGEKTVKSLATLNFKTTYLVVGGIIVSVLVITVAFVVKINRRKNKNI